MASEIEPGSTWVSSRTGGACEEVTVLGFDLEEPESVHLEGRFGRRFYLPKRKLLESYELKSDAPKDAIKACNNAKYFTDSYSVRPEIETGSVWVQIGDAPYIHLGNTPVSVLSADSTRVEFVGHGFAIGAGGGPYTMCSSTFTKYYRPLGKASSHTAPAHAPAAPATLETSKPYQRAQVLRSLGLHIGDAAERGDWALVKALAASAEAIAELGS